MSVNQARRSLLKGVLSATAAALFAALPRFAFSAWPEQAFRTKNIPDTLQALFGTASVITDTKGITLSVTDLAENGAVVPVTVSSTLPGVDNITLLVDKNPNTLVAQFMLAPGVKPFIKTNIKMAETSRVIALVRSEGKLYSTNKKVRVTLSGCSN
ncbi:MAG: thiosulfate oxidation carrier protein SoxY [Gammaproteobacteria bacterium]|nr:thiosulfate oxidation carrier protein SoxY [Gammaproteobacteria bacterium]